MDQIPAAMDRQLDVVRCHRDGGLLLGASSLTGRYWLGSLWFYSDPSVAPDVEKCSAGVQLEAGLQDATWVDASTVILGLDTGGIAIWGLFDDYRTFVLAHSVLEHDNIVSSISVSADGKHAVSGSHDNRIKVWDLAGLTCEKTYSAHTDLVCSVDFHPTDNNLFLTCGQGNTLLLWDQRNAKPASIIGCPQMQASPTCTSWQPGTAHTFAVGDEDGHMSIMDARMCTETVRHYVPHERRILRTEFSSSKPNLLASVAEDCVTNVASVTDRSVSNTYQACKHSDFVAGLTWFGSDYLYTCGWDSRVVKHSLIETQNNSMDESSITERA